MSAQHSNHPTSHTPHASHHPHRSAHPLHDGVTPEHPRLAGRRRAVHSDRMLTIGQVLALMENGPMQHLATGAQDADNTG